MPNFADPIDAVMIDDKIVKGPGKILTWDSTNNKVDLSAATEVALGISAGESERAAGGTMDITAAKVSFYPLGGVLMVQCAAGETLTTGETMYVGADGLATSTAGSNKKLGLYVGKGEVTPALVDSGAGDGLTNAGVTGTATTEGGMVPIMTAGAAIA
tara:strand:+ start:287 stop:760 length:474 start_codon:yes stop_codon:yes gene_type:complete